MAAGAIENGEGDVVIGALVNGLVKIDHGRKFGSFAARSNEPKEGTKVLGGGGGENEAGNSRIAAALAAEYPSSLPA